jgi:uncharacterized protein (DUF2141 family)
MGRRNTLTTFGDKNMTRITFTTRFAALAALALSAGVAQAQAETAPTTAPTIAMNSGATLTLTIEGVRSPRGKIMAALLKADATAGVARRVDATMATPVTGTTTVRFQGLAPGDYAIQLFHDENGNGEMDSNLFGIPSEGYAFSNRARGSFGPPKFEQMKFTVTAEPAATAAVMNY